MYAKHMTHLEPNTPIYNLILLLYLFLGKVYLFRNINDFLFVCTFRLVLGVFWLKMIKLTKLNWFGLFLDP